MASLSVFIILALVCFGYEIDAKKLRPRARIATPDILIRGYMDQDDLKSDSSEIDYNPLESNSHAGLNSSEMTSKILNAVGFDREVTNSHLSDVTMGEVTRALQDFGLINATVDGAAAKFMLEVYKNLKEGADLTRASGHKNIDLAILRADTVRGIPAKESHALNGAIYLTFNLSSLPTEEETKRAELRLHMSEATSRFQRFRAKVKVFSSNTLVTELKYTVWSEMQESSETAIVDLTAMLEDIINSGHRDSIIQIKLRMKKRKDNTRNRRALSTQGSDALLVVYTKDNQFFEKLRQDNIQSSPDITSRDRRSPRKSGRSKNKKAKSENRGLCEKRDFDIDFDQVGWGKWIIYPKRYNAFYCSGRCPSPVEHSFDPTNHAILQSILRIKNKNIPRPCCVPTKLRPLSMLYYENDEIVVRHHEEMIVDTCGCH